jgi:hypothetical protein
MEYAFYFAEIGAALLGVIFCSILLMLILRGNKIPECFSCGATKVRPSHAAGLWDSFARAFFINPYRCLGCRRRFHALSFFVGSKEPAKVQPQRVVKLVFRFRKGVPNRLIIRVLESSRESQISDAPGALQT